MRSTVLLAVILLVLGACAPLPGDRSGGTPGASADADSLAGPASPDASGGISAAPLAASDPLLAYELVDVRTGDSFSLGELAAEKPVLVETMAIWCTTCLTQQRELVQAHQRADFHSVGIDVDPNERAADLAEYAEREGFDWHFAMADAQLVQLLTDRYGFGVTNPPSTPTFVVSSDGTVRALEFGRVRTADELIAELESD